ncbi:hypothetical protein L3Q82_002977 [Scortum barcoo]|uniref:Uncharacterized protein n=1 Tax=Scortum barcoo TaxID=214431 RepID=A0ACB8VR19_9TELE|nr:hypothetical protein L3Q82_002977 [Scortum barcoo]
MSHPEEASGKTQDTLERLCLSRLAWERLGVPRKSWRKCLGRSGGMRRITSNLIFTAGLMMGFLSLRFLLDGNFSKGQLSHFEKDIRHEVKQGSQHAHTVQASPSANTFSITGHAETKQLTEMLPGTLNQLEADSLSSPRKQFPWQWDRRAVKEEITEEEDDAVPDLVENFDEASKNEAN